ncbi:hypothetical protein CY34DRAFT_19960 [Suillus luteus UH-Slu-Lm8-n1]|uniref:Uncharacterized protein n=1 Tax=Suillus luteus UH-Slu-Lm8-n1 TaxID=930992 RepID=A0A0D0AH77_9AGAM|nr:hypothetical protein CY34DRAFT_19960 [Suillus luteus UH-Slu-Lm8-n1]
MQAGNVFAFVPDVSSAKTLYVGTIHFNILLGASKPESEQSLPDGFNTEVAGKGSQLWGSKTWASLIGQNGTLALRSFVVLVQ